MLPEILYGQEVLAELMMMKENPFWSMLREMLYVSGYFSGTSILKLNSNGNFIWAKAIGNSGGNFVTSMDIDSLKNIYCTGTFYGTVDFDPGVGIANLMIASFRRIYFVKLDSSGTFNWAKNLDGRIAILPTSLKYRC